MTIDIILNIYSSTDMIKMTKALCESVSHYLPNVSFSPRVFNF